MLTIGIDPGLTGAIGVLAGGCYVNCKDIPVMQRSTGSAKVTNQVDGNALADLLRELTKDHDRNATLVLIEMAQSMPAAVKGKGGVVKIVQGGASIFSTGHSAGTIEGVVAALRLPHRLVRPGDWKKALRLTSTKEQCRAFARRLFPDAPLHLVKHHNRAESLLLAHYGHTVYA